MRILFFGTPDFAAVQLQALLEHPQFEIGLVVTQPDRPAGRGSRLTPSPVKILAEKHSIPVLQPTSLKKELVPMLEQIQTFGKFDLGVVIAFGQILPLEILNFPRAGCVNVHASLLPRWRGAAPIQRAIMAGDTATGICLMQMEEGLDTGAVYARAEVSITAEDTSGTLHDKLATLGAKLLVENLALIAAGDLDAVAQPAQGVTYAKKISNQECEVQFSRPADEILRHIHALSPTPGAFSWLDGKRVKLWRAQSWSTPVEGAALPGKVMLATGTGMDVHLVVACGRGVLEILELQLEGKKRVSAQEFMRGTQDLPATFGSSAP